MDCFLVLVATLGDRNSKGMAYRLHPQIAYAAC